MRVLFVGLGSIGQRHLRNLKDQVSSDLDVLVYRKTNHNLIIEDGQARECISLREHYDYTQVNSLEDGLRLKPHIVFITNPTSEHLYVAIAAARAGANIFIEKPLSNSIDHVSRFLSIVRDKKLVVSVGYQTKYNPIFSRVASIIADESFGGAVSADFEWGTFLPDHHPYEDYSNGYAANIELGGGVTLGLIHEIDLIYSFFGNPEKIFSCGGQVSKLEMTSEDTISALFGFSRNGNHFPVTLRLSYAQVHETRSFRISFNHGFLVCDLVSNDLTVFGAGGEIRVQERYDHIDRDQLFKAQMSDFLGRVSTNDSSLHSLEGGIKTLEIALAIKDNIL